MEALLVIEPPNIVPPSENAVGTAVILDFIIIFCIFLRRQCPGQSFKVEGLKFGIKVGSDSLICTWGYDF